MNALAVALEIASAFEQLQESCAPFEKALGTIHELSLSSPGQPIPLMFSSASSLSALAAHKALSCELC